MSNKIMRTICLLIAVSSLVTVSFADTVEIAPPGYGNDYSTQDNPYIFGTKANEMSEEEKAENNIVDPFSVVSTRASVEKLCFVDGTSNWDVYSTANGNTKIGFVGPRERVYVKNNNENSSRYYITFLSYGVEKQGYVDKRAVKVPDTNWARPVESGYISQDYGVDGHTGIDVGVGTGTAIKAVKNSTHKSQVYTAYVNGVEKLVNFGNYIETTTDGVQVIYAHLSDFERGTASSLDSYRSLWKGEATITTKQTWTPSSGAKIGESGNSGNSSGPHLHFEVRKSEAIGIKYDPYEYVVFPDIGY